MRKISALCVVEAFQEIFRVILRSIPDQGGKSSREGGEKRHNTEGAEEEHREHRGTVTQEGGASSAPTKKGRPKSTGRRAA